MKKLILGTILMLLIVSLAYGKRLSAPIVKPLIYEGVKYSAPSDLMGMIRAEDIKSNSELWLKQIYIIKYIPNLEKDIQDVFINNLEIKLNTLIITNEKGYIYELDLKELLVKVIKGKKIIQMTHLNV